MQVVSTSQWGPDVLGLDFVGEVVNNTSTNESLVQLNLGFYNSSGTLLGTDFAFTSLDVLAPGEKSPFEDDFTPPVGYDHTNVLSIDPTPTSVAQITISPSP